MPFRKETVSINLDEAVDRITPELGRLMESNAETIVAALTRGWYGESPGYGSSPHADGKPSQSTGASADGWFVDEAEVIGDQLKIAVENDVDYAEYVHRAGDEVGHERNKAKAFWEAEVDRINAAIQDIVRDLLPRR